MTLTETLEKCIILLKEVEMQSGGQEFRRDSAIENLKTQIELWEKEVRRDENSNP